MIDIKDNGVVLRVRLTPNSSSCYLNGIYTSADGECFAKINVISVPEKGKANIELIKLLAKICKQPKSNFEIISGDTNRYKKIFISGDALEISTKLKTLFEKEN